MLKIYTVCPNFLKKNLKEEKRKLSETAKEYSKNNDVYCTILASTNQQALMLVYSWHMKYNIHF